MNSVVYLTLSNASRRVKLFFLVMAKAGKKKPYYEFFTDFLITVKATKDKSIILELLKIFCKRKAQQNGAKADLWLRQLKNEMKDFAVIVLW